MILKRFGLLDESEKPNIEENVTLCPGGLNFAIFLSGGTLKTIGHENCYNQLGIQKEVALGNYIPQEFSTAFKDEVIVAACAGVNHCVAASENGTIFSWGWNKCVPEEESPAVESYHRNEKIPEESHKKRQKFESPEKENEINGNIKKQELSGVGKWPPIRTKLPGNLRVKSVAAGFAHTLALDEMGQLWGWGENKKSQLGFPTSQFERILKPHSLLLGPEPLTPNNTPKGIFVACGAHHSGVILDSGDLLTCGWGLYGQCGHGTTDDEPRLRQVASLSGLKVTAVAMGVWHTVALTEAGEVLSWGGNQFGQLGGSGTHSQVLPQVVESPLIENTNFVKISSGARHTVALTDSGEVFAWGWNKFGQLGENKGESLSEPIEINCSNPAVDISCGWWHTLVLEK